MSIRNSLTFNYCNTQDELAPNAGPTLCFAGIGNVIILFQNSLSFAGKLRNFTGDWCRIVSVVDVVGTDNLFRCNVT